MDLGAVSGTAALTPRRAGGRLHRLPLAAAVVAIFVALLWYVAVRQAALFAIGVGMGAVLAAARRCV